MEDLNLKTKGQLIKRIRFLENLLEIEFKDYNKLLCESTNDKRILLNIIIELSLHFDVFNYDRGLWSMCNYDLHNVIFKKLGIKELHPHYNLSCNRFRNLNFNQKKTF